MTIVASYDTTKNLSSNQLGAYYHSIGGHEGANHFLHEVLGAPATESFGGDYGEAVPSPPLSYHFTTSRTSFGRNVTIPADHAPTTALQHDERHYDGRMVAALGVCQGGPCYGQPQLIPMAG